MCTGRDLDARVARARLPYEETLVSWDLLGACEDVCARAVPACGVRKSGVGARRESGQRHGCGEAVPGAASGRRRDRVLFIGTQFSILYTSMYLPA